MTQTILLTGITGFIAKRIARDLLAKGYAVRGSLRRMDRADEVRAAMGDTPTDKLSFVELDLMADAGWAEAMEGIDALMHTASPFPMAQPKNAADLIGPAVDGTLRALMAAQAAGVSRVVLTSSMVAVMHVDRPKGHAFTARDWTDTGHVTASAYVQSKTLAERAAWDFVGDHPEMQLTTVNPGLVCGTPMDTHYGTSLNLIQRLMSGKDPMQPNFGLPIVDVADVSALHIAALENDATVGHRLLATAGHMMFPDVAKLLAAAYPNRKISTKIAPKFLLRGLALFDPAVRSILPIIGHTITVDNSATIKLTGHSFTPPEDAILASAAYIDAENS